MKLQIHPLIALADQKVTISISELPAFSKVKLSASLCFPWAPDFPFESFAWFTADARGNVDLSKQKPDSGSYDFVDSMGLIASVKCKDPKSLGAIGENISVDKSLFIDIVAECGQDRAYARLERLFVAKDVQRQRISDEFVGELFYTDNPNNKTVLLIGGSSGGLDPNLPIAALLASHGLNVLTVAYFKEKGLPAQLAEIPLEYFERVFAWLSHHPITTGKDVYIHGTSKGAELSLILASRYPFIKRMALVSPHAYCFQGIAFFKNVSSWTYEGKPLPYIRLKWSWLITNMLSCFIRNKPFGYAYMFKKGLNVAKNKEAARIKVENAQADLLLFTNKQCNIWNTYDGSVQIMDTLRTHNYPHYYDLVVYEDTGEPYPAPYVIPAGLTTVRLAPRLVLSIGGTLEGNMHAAADSWEKAIEFLKEGPTVLSSLHETQSGPL
jgi:hypothetical protein